MFCDDNENPFVEWKRSVNFQLIVNHPQGKFTINDVPPEKKKNLFVAWVYGVEPEEMANMILAELTKKEDDVTILCDYLITKETTWQSIPLLVLNVATLTNVAQCPKWINRPCVPNAARKRNADWRLRASTSRFNGRTQPAVEPCPGLTPLSPAVPGSGAEEQVAGACDVQ